MFDSNTIDTLQELQNFVPFSKDVGHLFNVNIH